VDQLCRGVLPAIADYIQPVAALDLTWVMDDDRGGRSKWRRSCQRLRPPSNAQTYVWGRSTTSRLLRARISWLAGTELEATSVDTEGGL
jgi:hypothetical protein